MTFLVTVPSKMNRPPAAELSQRECPFCCAWAPHFNSWRPRNQLRFLLISYVSLVRLPSRSDRRCGGPER